MGEGLLGEDIGGCRSSDAGSFQGPEQEGNGSSPELPEGASLWTVNPCLAWGDPRWIPDFRNCEVTARLVSGRCVVTTVQTRSGGGATDTDWARGRGLGTGQGQRLEERGCQRGLRRKLRLARADEGLWDG